MRRRRQEGATLLEIMISLALVLLGMLALFKVLTTSISGSATSSRLSQAQVRLITILESIRHSPTDTNGIPVVMNCLMANTPGPNWSACETLCKSLLTNPTQDACIYTLQSFSFIPAPDPTGASAHKAGGQTLDRNLQQYVIDPDDTKIQLAGTNGFVYDVTLTIGWNDDNGTQYQPIAGWHQVKIRTGIFE
jgi:type II secretory pathway pseudopilin PulG